MQIPRTSQVVRARSRHYLVSEVIHGTLAEDATLIRLSCLDDDAAGDPLELLWEREPATEILEDEEVRLGLGLDSPQAFGAWLHALQWSCVTSTEKALFQSPFRAGIAIKPYQLEPLRKALDLPRSNLFIADDVGLGKTIEAGLVLSELMLRQRVERVLVVCPPSVTIQWKEELEQRFGLGFAIYDRDWISARRRERGWGINPWSTHTRFIVSYPMLRGTGLSRDQHLKLLLNLLGDKTPRSMLILDEAHQVAPASGTLYATDTRTTHAIRQLVHRFEHRLFLSATPHNGHSNSFSTLLEMLDPQRFTRGVNVNGPESLAPIMVRRLKRDLRSTVGGLPERLLVDHLLRMPPNAPEIHLGQLLAQYEICYRKTLQLAGVKDLEARALVCVNLHKRLLSSIYAFSRTLEAHAKSALLPAAAQQTTIQPMEDEDNDISEEERNEREEGWVSVATVSVGEEAAEILKQMRHIALQNREQPDIRLRELARWIRENLLTDGRWNRRRLVVFTEYDDTLQWILRQLPELLGISSDDRIGRYTGGLSDRNRQAIKEAFTIDPDRHPLRILLCTDAAREGINLQSHCADLFHFDLPWNPSRVEQRNGRIDRTLQPEAQVRCHYFDLPDRPEDRVLTYMVQKLRRIHEELGSLADVLSERLAARLEGGIRTLDTAEIDRVTAPDAAAMAAVEVLENRGREGGLTGDLRALGKILKDSERHTHYNEEHLRELTDLGLQLAGAAPLQVLGAGRYKLPELGANWADLIDPLRARPPADAPPWFRPAVRPITFSPVETMDGDAVQLHLGHPLIRRLLARFLAPGWAEQQLNRITVLEGPDRRVIAFGRLVLFGPRASRLHEEVVVRSARILSDGSLKLFGEQGTETTFAALSKILESHPRPHPDAQLSDRLRQRATADYRYLWGELRSRGQEAEADARSRLKARADEEATEMLHILERQEQGILRTQTEARQLGLKFTPQLKAEREQLEADLVFMQKRLESLNKEKVSEPASIHRSYEVVLSRFEPLGLVYFWGGS